MRRSSRRLPKRWTRFYSWTKSGRKTQNHADFYLINHGYRDENDLGPANKWPECLQSLVPFIFTLSHPAAVFWGDKLVMVYNKAWEATAHTALRQGKSSSDSFSGDTTKILREYSQGRISRAIAASELSTHHVGDTEMPPVVCSPVLDQKEVSGVLVQIFCKTHVQAGGDQTRGKSRAQEGQKDSPGEKMDDFVDHEETALDRQPFFQKFAEMLPTGLAILNHKADPLFVNHQFHDLTAHQGPDHSFRMWPETIHPEDHDRVMSEYQRAFESQTELEIEFRAFGESQWRLFLMRPLGKNNLRQFSLREFGGYICALIDVSDMKNAELAQTRVAKEARERKQQQERFIDMISHEIRNPLSAVLHCTEDILDAVQDGEIKPEKIIVDDIVEAVHTIQLCVDHQKTLVRKKATEVMLLVVLRNEFLAWLTIQHSQDFQLLHDKPIISPITIIPHIKLTFCSGRRCLVFLEARCLNALASTKASQDVVEGLFLANRILELHDLNLKWRIR